VSQTSNPILDHLFAKMVFYLAQMIPAGESLLVEIEELGDDEFCAEQILVIAEDEGEQEKKPIKTYLKSQICDRHPLGALTVKDSFKKEVSGNRLGPNTLVVIWKTKPIHGLLFNVDTYIQLSSDGYIKILKNRPGKTTVEPIPWESFMDQKHIIHDTLGRYIP